MDAQTAEAGEAYLNAMGFRSLIEWITAESLLSRPEDPLAFIRLITDEKLAERPVGDKYNADHALAFLKQCYAAASASADENGRITIRPRKASTAPSSSTRPSDGDSALIKRLAMLEKTIHACRQIAMRLEPNEAAAEIMKQACIVLNAERSTLFIHEKSSNTLVLKYSEGAADIRVPFGTGIAGTVAATGKTVSIVDAYSDPNFDSQYDKNTGYKTKSILCMPVRDHHNRIVGVMQALNKVAVESDTAGFSEQDEEIMGILAAEAGVALYNAREHAAAILAHERVKDVLAIVQDLHRDLGFSSIMFTISTRVQRLINSDRCTLYIVDRPKNELWTLQGEVNIRVPISQGIAGAAVETNQAINLEDAYADPRFNQEFDIKLGYRTRSILAMPLRNHNAEVIAVMQLINKLGDDGVFTLEDEQLLGTFVQIAGPLLATSQSHLPKTTPAADEMTTEFPTNMNARSQQADRIEMGAISESGEDQGGEDQEA